MRLLDLEPPRENRLDDRQPGFPHLRRQSPDPLGRPRAFVVISLVHWFRQHCDFFDDSELGRFVEVFELQRFSR